MNYRNGVSQYLLYIFILKWEKCRDNWFDNVSIGMYFTCNELAYQSVNLDRAQ